MKAQSIVVRLQKAYCEVSRTLRERRSNAMLEKLLRFRASRLVPNTVHPTHTVSVELTSVSATMSHEVG